MSGPKPVQTTADLLEAARAAKLREQVNRILDKLDAVDDSKFRNRRNGARTSFRRHDVAVHVSHPGGSTITRTVSTRNLSPSGLGILYNSFLHIGTQLEIVLVRRLGGEDRIKGHVVFCAHVSGVFHQVGVRFDQKVFPKLYTDTQGVERDEARTAALAAVAAKPVAPSLPLRGSVLLIESPLVERVLMEHHLKNTDVKLAAVGDERSGLKVLKESPPFDLVMVDLNLETSTGETTIAAIRSAGYRGPICLIAGERAPARIEAAIRAGANDVLAKPYDQGKLLAHLTTHLSRPAPALAAPQVPSASPADMTPSMANYVMSVQGLAEEIHRAAENRELDRLRQMCISLRASGSTYGFARLYDAAREAVQMLDASMSVDESLKQIMELADLCKRVSPAK